MSDIKTMKKLKNLKNLKHYTKLLNKRKGIGPMPQLRWVSNLLDEIGVEHSYHDWSETKWSRPAGFRYYTSGGTREYTGGRLRISEINFDATSTDTYYSYNTWSYCKELLDLVHDKLGIPRDENWYYKGEIIE